MGSIFYLIKSILGGFLVGPKIVVVGMEGLGVEDVRV